MVCAHGATWDLDTIGNVLQLHKRALSQRLAEKQGPPKLGRSSLG